MPCRSTRLPSCLSCDPDDGPLSSTTTSFSSWRCSWATRPRNSRTSTPLVAAPIGCALRVEPSTGIDIPPLSLKSQTGLPWRETSRAPPSDGPARKRGTQGGRLDSPSILVPSKHCVSPHEETPPGADFSRRSMRRGLARSAGSWSPVRPAVRGCSRLEGLRGRACATEWRFSPVVIVWVTSPSRRLVRRIDGVTMTETPSGEPKAAAAEAPAPVTTPASETKAVPFWKRLFGKS